MRTFVSILALLVITTSMNAQLRKKVTGSGDVTTETRTVTDYTKVGVAGSFDVTLVEGTSNKVTVEAYENLMEYIVTEVKKNTLQIKTKKGYNIRSNKAIKVTVTYDKLEAVSLAGSGDIVSDGQIQSDNLKLSLAGSGDISLGVDSKYLKTSIAGSGNINLSGNSDELHCSVAGSGNVNADGMQAGVTKVSIAGSGDVKVHAVDEIHAKIAGSGNVVYSGNPDVEKSNSAGSGKLKKKG
jgi:hypothetical protein